ncbi:hypothetical protein COW81_00925 [Candidatus Campbellbacteria bacterium CG22_combo_CG10-13_8_21_14_all_36_13]|uniref:DUF4015 domain-containing protein n=1 Tax=Candidatus Campbellbacteria bacterium CG22_combo_CG10-13_8_21_14_all_36_13 TaxID=1974529 RepID=A0A2H0DYR2_9BACT|nr:MAG: hypothetical protein COW81_00925 [Candidatus Campbellbacteria bacterium CG22_combo_CG10-13_8_21_14_all_36_13]
MSKEQNTNTGKQMSLIHNRRFQATFFVVFVILIILYFGISQIFASSYKISNKTNTASVEESIQEEELVPKFVATHIKTPESLRAVYMTSWVAGTPSIREKIIKLIDSTEANAVVIDIKDDTGRVSFDMWDKELDEIGSEEIRIPDLRELIEMFHEKGVYVIGRISSFQDLYMVKLHPEWAVKRKSDGAVWKDRKGISWIDAGAKENWDYLVALGKESYNAGFDELNYDYIRFPSDGNMNDIYYPFSEQNILADPEWGKAKTIELYFAYLHDNLKDTGAVLSADLFGMTTTNYDDLNIGQVLERALPYFDYIAPMVYPSHYPKTFIGLANPAANPYEVIDYSLSKALARIDVLKTSTTTPEWIRNKVRREQIRPWLQDFDLGATYTADMVRAQIQATYDNGLTSFMLWDAANTYTPGGLLPN